MEKEIKLDGRAKNKQLELELFKKLNNLPPRCKEAKLEAFLELIKIHKRICVECELKQGVRKLP